MNNLFIAIVSSYPNKRCGVGLYSSHLVAALRENGVRVTIVGDKESTKADFRLDFKSPFLCLELLRAAKKLPSGVVWHLQHEPGLYSRLNFLPAVLLLRTLGCQVMLTFHALTSRWWNGIREFLSQIYLQVQIATCTLLANHVIVNSAHHRHCIPKHLRHKSSVICFGSTRAEKPKRILSSPPRFLYFGMVSKQKGVKKLLEAIKEIDCELAIVGTPVDEETAKWLLTVSDSEKNVRITPEWVNEEVKSRAFEWSDILILPYLSGGRQSGVLSDAISFGRPVVCTPLPPISTFVESAGIGVVACGFSATNLAEAMKRAVTDYTSFGTAILANQSRSWEDVAFDHLKVYREVSGAQP